MDVMLTLHGVLLCCSSKVRGLLFLQEDGVSPAVSMFISLGSHYYERGIEHNLKAQLVLHASSEHQENLRSQQEPAAKMIAASG